MLNVTEARSAFEHPKSGAVVVGYTNDVLPGVLVAYSDELDLLYPLTNCCGASAKGSANVESGVVCRACYREIPTELAGECRFA